MPRRATLRSATPARRGNESRGYVSATRDEVSVRGRNGQSRTTCGGYDSPGTDLVRRSHERSGTIRSAHINLEDHTTESSTVPPYAFTTSELRVRRAAASRDPARRVVEAGHARIAAHEALLAVMADHAATRRVYEAVVAAVAIEADIVDVERRFLADLGDEVTRAVYADWLEERGLGAEAEGVPAWLGVGMPPT